MWAFPGNESVTWTAAPLSKINKTWMADKPSVINETYGRSPTLGDIKKHAGRIYLLSVINETKKREKPSLDDKIYCNIGSGPTSR